MRSRQAAEEDHNRSQVFVRHVAEVFVGHDRKQRCAVGRDTFADGAGDGVIAPLADAGFRIRSDIGRDETKIALFKYDLPEPSWEASTGGFALSSCLEWHPMQCMTACTR